MKNQNQLWNLLLDGGIVEGDNPLDQLSVSPWYVKALLAFSGWLASIFIIGFIGAALAFVFNNSITAGFFGFAMVISAFFILRKSPNDFVEHIGLALSMAGQALITYCLFDLSGYDDVMQWLSLVILQVLLIAFMPNFIHWVFSSLVGGIALSIMLGELGLPFLSCGLILWGITFSWLNEFRFTSKIKKVRAIGYGLVLALIITEIIISFGGNLVPEEIGFLNQHWIGEGIILIASLYLVFSLLKEHKISLYSHLSIITLLATLVLFLVSIKVNGLTTGMVILSLGFYASNRLVLGLGILSLLSSISYYYYLMETTLLMKSQSLLIAGMALLVSRWLMHKLFGIKNGGKHE